MFQDFYQFMKSLIVSHYCTRSVASDSTPLDLACLPLFFQCTLMLASPDIQGKHSDLEQDMAGYRLFNLTKIKSQIQFGITSIHVRFINVML